MATPAAVQERYSRATVSAKLRLTRESSGEGPCDADKLIAAGAIAHQREPGLAGCWLSTGLGTALYRLRAEFDRAASDARRAHAVVDEAETRASVAGSAAKAAAIRKAAADQALTEYLLVLMQLRTLRTTRIKLGEFALLLATRRKHMLNDRTVALLAGRVLDVYLDPLCRHCGGRGFSGGYSGEMRMLCRPCRGTGHRRETIGRNEPERAFAADLLTEMQRGGGITAGRMGRLLG